MRAVIRLNGEFKLFKKKSRAFSDGRFIFTSCGKTKESSMVMNQPSS